MPTKHLNITVEKKIKLSDIRRAVADYMSSEGCNCCRSIDEHIIHERILAEMLKVPKYKDRSGFNFARFRTKRKKRGIQRL